MYQNGARGQQNADHLYDASGALASSAVAKLVLPERPSTTWLRIQNLSAAAMWVEFGAARATCAITLGAVSGYTVTNGGFGYTHPPDVFFLGGGYAGNTARLPAGFPGFAAPGQSGDPTGSHPAKAHAVLTADVVTSIVTEDAGSGYGIAPFLFMSNSVLDRFGCADPSVSSGSGIKLAATGTVGDTLLFDGNFCPTDAIAIFGANSAAYSIKWAP